MGKVNRRTNEQGILLGAAKFIWRRILATCEESGLTQEQWCEEHNININTLRDRATRLHRLDERAEELLAERRSDWVEVTSEESPPTNDVCRSADNRIRRISADRGRVVPGCVAGRSPQGVGSPYDTPTAARPC
jgi:hypothetical protein